MVLIKFLSALIHVTESMTELFCKHCQILCSTQLSPVAAEVACRCKESSSSGLTGSNCGTLEAGGVRRAGGSTGGGGKEEEEEEEEEGGGCGEAGLLSEEGLRSAGLRALVRYSSRLICSSNTCCSLVHSGDIL